MKKKRWKVDDILLTEKQVNTARENNLEYHHVYHRMKRLGYDIERAITQPLDQRNISVEGRRIGDTIITSEQLEIAKRNGINYKTLYNRIRKGMPIEEAIHKTRRYWTVGGQKLTGEQMDRANKNGLYLSIVVMRVKQGMNLEDAISRPVEVHKKKAPTGFPAKTKVGKREMIIGYYKTEEEARQAEKRAMEALT